MNIENTEKTEHTIVVALIGLTVGALLVYSLMDRRTQTQPLSQTNKPNQVQQNDQQIWLPMEKIPSVEETMKKLQAVNSLDEKKIENTNSKIQAIQPEFKQENQYTNHTIYKNNEKWQIIRGPDGSISSLDIIRDVKKS